MQFCLLDKVLLIILEFRLHLKQIIFQLPIVDLLILHLLVLLFDVVVETPHFFVQRDPEMELNIPSLHIGSFSNDGPFNDGPNFTGFKCFPEWSSQNYI